MPKLHPAREPVVPVELTVLEALKGTEKNPYALPDPGHDEGLFHSIVQSISQMVDLCNYNRL